RRRIEQPYVMSGLHDTRGPGTDFASARLRDVIRALGHSEPLVDLLSEAPVPRGDHLRRERLTGAHAVAQGGHVAGASRRFFEYLAVERRHPDEDGRAVLGDQARPGARIGGTVVNDRGDAAVERVYQPGAEHVGPIVFARVQHPIALAAEIEPVLRG